MMSVRVAITVLDVELPFAATTEVWPLPALPISRAMFWMEQAAKKSSTGDVWFRELVYCGCWKEVLETPLAEA